MVRFEAVSFATPASLVQFRIALCRDLVQKRSLHQSSAGNTHLWQNFRHRHATTNSQSCWKIRPEVALVKPADAEERAVPAALLEFLGEAPSSPGVLELLVAADQAPSAAALRCHQPATQRRAQRRSASSGCLPPASGGANDVAARLGPRTNSAKR